MLTIAPALLLVLSSDFSAVAPPQEPAAPPAAAGDEAAYAEKTEPEEDRVAKALDSPAGTVAAEVYLDAIPVPRSIEHARPAYAPPALQSVTRDFAFLVPEDLPADALIRAIRGADKAIITDARLFDR